MEKESINLGLIDEFINSNKVVLNNCLLIEKEAGEIEKRYAFSEDVIVPNRFRLRKVLRILALVLTFARKLRRLSVCDTEHSFDIPKSFSYKGCQYIVTTGTNDVIKCEPGEVVCLADVFFSLKPLLKSNGFEVLESTVTSQLKSTEFFITITGF